MITAYGNAFMQSEAIKSISSIIRFSLIGDSKILSFGYLFLKLATYMTVDLVFEIRAIWVICSYATHGL